MYVKVKQKPPTGIPAARVIAAPGENAMGAHQVTMFVHALDQFGFPTVVAAVMMSTAEATALAEQLDKAAAPKGAA